MKKCTQVSFILSLLVSFSLFAMEEQQTWPITLGNAGVTTMTNHRLICGIGLYGVWRDPSFFANKSDVALGGLVLGTEFGWRLLSDHKKESLKERVLNFCKENALALGIGGGVSIATLAALFYKGYISPEPLVKLCPSADGMACIAIDTGASMFLNGREKIEQTKNEKTVRKIIEKSQEAERKVISQTLDAQNAEIPTLVLRTLKEHKEQEERREELVKPSSSGNLTLDE